MRIIDKKGPLKIQPIAIIVFNILLLLVLFLVHLTADHYEDEIANDPRIDPLREKMICVENKQYTKDYLDPDKRSIANAVQIFFKDGTKSEKIEIEYPLGHKCRRGEGLPLLKRNSPKI